MKERERKREKDREREKERQSARAKDLSFCSLLPSTMNACVLHKCLSMHLFRIANVTLLN